MSSNPPGGRCTSTLIAFGPLQSVAVILARMTGRLIVQRRASCGRRQSRNDGAETVPFQYRSPVHAAEQGGAEPSDVRGFRGERGR